MKTHSFVLFVLLVVCVESICLAQGGGMGAGAGAAYNAYQNQPTSHIQYSQANSSELIAVSGAAEVSVKPESLRLVFAVTAEGKSSRDCSDKTKETIASIRRSLEAIEIAKADIVEDFIVVLPLYIWNLDKVEGNQVIRESKDGYRMQTNLHVLCDDEKQAMAVIDIAFGVGVTEIVSFDYVHSELDNHKREALKKAVEEAKSKAEILLSVFDEKPRVLNIGNSIKVSYPQSLYKTLAPKPVDQTIIPYAWRNHLKVKAHRPLTTFYAGSQDYADSSPSRPAMNPEISIVATVTLTYSSPAREERLEIEREKSADAKSEVTRP